VGRGTHPDDPSVSYWRAERRTAGGKWKGIWAGWRTRPQAEREVAGLVASGEAEAVATHQTNTTGGVSTVGDLLDRWLPTVEARGRRGDIARKQRDRQYESGLPDEDPSRRRAKPRAMGGAESRALSRRTVQKYQTASRAIKRSPLAQVRLLDLGRNPDILVQYADARQTANPKTGRKAAAPATVALELRVLQAAWSWGSKPGRAYTSGLKLTLPYLEITSVRDQVTPSSEGLDRVVSALPSTPAGRMVKAQRMLGCRIEALERLVVREVDPATERLRLLAKGHDRIVRMPTGLSDLLHPLLGGRDPADRVFAGVSRDAFQGVIDRTLRHLNGADEPVLAASCPKCRAGSSDPCTGPGGGEGRFHVARRAAAGELPRAAAAKPPGGARTVKRFTSHGIRRRRSQEAREAGIAIHVYARLFGHSAEEALRAYGQPTLEDETRAWAAADGRAQGQVIALKTRSL